MGGFARLQKLFSPARWLSSWSPCGSVLLPSRGLCALVQGSRGREVKMSHPTGRESFSSQLPSPHQLCYVPTAWLQRAGCCSCFV